MDPRKFGCEVSVQPNAHRPYRLWRRREGTYKAARLGEGYTFASATFFRRETLLGNPRSVWREIARPSSLCKTKKKIFSLCTCLQLYNIDSYLMGPLVCNACHIVTFTVVPFVSITWTSWFTGAKGAVSRTKDK